MQENTEYCDSQDFQVVLIVSPPTIYEGGFKIWQCKRCAFEFSQHPISDEKPVFPTYHPKPIPMFFTISEEQKARLKERLDKKLQDVRWCNRITFGEEQMTLQGTWEKLSEEQKLCVNEWRTHIGTYITEQIEAFEKFHPELLLSSSCTFDVLLRKDKPEMQEL